ncbi:MAG: hypothetical protein NC930_09855 [Candidatus Omnitrophica bacterium]|nr:hypothetical protein [Candidatus Omnitrophota bacterium]
MNPFCSPCGIKSILLVLIVGLVLLSVLKRFLFSTKNSDPGLSSARGFLFGGWGDNRKGTFEGIPYQSRYQGRTRHSASYFKLWIPCRSAGAFKISKENFVDRFFKNTGISVELQTGDMDFDQNFYVESDAVNFMRTYFADPAKREAVKTLFALGFNELRHDGKRLEVKQSPCPSCPDWDQAFIKQLFSCLKVLGSGMSDSYAMGDSETISPRKLERRLIFGIALVLLLTGIVALLYGDIRYHPFDGWSLFVFSLRYSIPAFVLFFIVAVYALKGQASSHKNLLSLFFLSLFAFPLASYGLLVVSNGYGDSGDLSVHTVGVIGKHIVHHKNSRSYYLTVQSWRPQSAWENFQVPSGVYYRASEGRSQIVVRTKPGILGFEWRVDFEVLE